MMTDSEKINRREARYYGQRVTFALQAMVTWQEDAASWRTVAASPSLAIADPDAVRSFLETAANRDSLVAMYERTAIAAAKKAAHYARLSMESR